MAQLSEVLPPDHPAYTMAIEAIRRYHEALSTGVPIIEVERLRQVDGSRQMETKA